ncbi:MAG TPA: hypothetical protein VFO66_01660 [Gemmatimonadaceae bacterium]|nr:hypothetical protein [Gemmatimonadaceae bacterium]
MSETEPVIRPLASEQDYQACVALQYETWGNAFREAVPPSILLVSQKLGGVAAGAFDERDRLLGFVFGMTGVRNGAIVHWSDMLAVRPEAQNAGIGRKLKEHQRRAVAAVGATAVVWTFDPLMARNAHLNFNVFGARAIEYVPDMYGHSTGSDLHRGIGTDRFLMEWPVSDDELARQRSAAAAERLSPGLRVAVPADFTSILRTDPAEARRWREETRSALTSALAGGMRVVGFERAGDDGRGYYLLAR